jgi:hypothetical protein
MDLFIAVTSEELGAVSGGFLYHPPILVSPSPPTWPPPWRFTNPQP